MHCRKAKAMRESLEDLTQKIGYTMITENAMSIEYVHVCMYMCRQLRLALQEDETRRKPLMIVEK